MQILLALAGLMVGGSAAAEESATSSAVASGHGVKVGTKFPNDFGKKRGDGRVRIGTARQRAG
jgi:hypothetical protein